MNVAKRMLVAGAAAALLLSTGSRAFHLPPAVRGAVTVRRDPPSSTSLRAHSGGSTPLSRRAALNLPAAATGASLLLVAGGAAPSPVHAVLGGAAQGARVASWPGIEGLEPLYELKLSIDALAASVGDPAKWPFIQKRLERFFKGAILSEKNFYLGVAFQYMNDIKYDRDELPEYIRLDKEARFNAMEATMASLGSLKAALGTGDAGAVEDSARAARGALASWFALVPEDDVRAVEQLFVDVKKADINRDGKLSDDELGTLPEDERETWKRRVAKFG